MIVQQAIHLGVIGAGIVIALMFVLWLIHLPLRNAAVIDVGWALGLAVLALYYAYAGPGYKARKYALAVVVGFWGFRLAAYLLFSRVIGHPEEGRYVELRKEWKRHLPLRFLFFFEFQALLDVILSAPFLIAALNPHAPLGILEKSGQRGQDVSQRTLEIFAPSKLFFRLDDVGRLRRVRARLAMGMDRADFAGAGFVFPARCHRHSRDGSSGTSQPRRRVSRISAHDEFVRPVVPEKSASEIVMHAPGEFLSTFNC